MNSGFYIGYLEEILSLITFILENHVIDPTNSDQNHFHQIYTNETLRNSFDIKLDHKSEIVYNIFLAEHEGEIHCRNGSIRYKYVLIAHFLSKSISKQL